MGLRCSRLSLTPTDDPLETHIEGRAIYPSLEQEIGRWIEDQSTPHRAILGAFGSGKSWFCLELASSMMRQFLERPSRRRLPVLIRLKDFPGVSSLTSLLERFGAARDTAVGRPEVFRYLSTNERLVLILDGLDELSLEEEATVAERLALLAEAAVPGSKVLLTSRTGFFQSLQDRHGLLLDRFRILEIEDLDGSQIREFLEKRGADVEATVRRISDTYDLPDLAKRPVMLEMILETLKEIPQGQAVDAHDLYRIYTDRWIEQAERSHRRNLDRQARRKLMVAAAKEIYRREETATARERLDPTLSLGRLTELMADVLGDLDDQAGAEVLREELVTQTFLVPTGDDRYTFAHRSFLEYFIAGEVLEEIRRGQPDILRRSSLSPEIVDFVSAYEVSQEAVWSLLDESRRGENEARLNGNLLSILQDIGASFRRRNLSRLRANDANLSGVDLTGSDFRNAVLLNWNVRDACLGDTDFRGATLENWNLGVRSAGKGVRFLPGRLDVVTCSSDHEVVLLASGESEPRALYRHEDSVTAVAATATAGGYIASSGFDRLVRIWDLGSSSSLGIYSHMGVVYGVCCSPDGRYVASSDKKGRCRIWHRDTGEVVLQWLAHGSNEVVYSIDWGPDPRPGHSVVATSSFDRTVALWFLEHHPEEPLLLRHRHVLKGHSGLVNRIRFSPDGNLLASTSNDHTARLWDVAERRQVATLRGHEDTVWAAAFHPDGRWLATGSSDKTVRLWDLESRNEVGPPLTGHEAEVWDLDFDGSGNYLATGSLDGTVRLWSVHGGECLRQWRVGRTDDQGLDARGMKIRDVKALSPLQERLLELLGAET